MRSGSSDFVFRIDLRTSLACRLIRSSRSVAELPRCLRGGLLLSPLGVQHFNEQVVAGHVAVQVFVVEVLLGLQADRSDLRQPEEQLAELVRLLRVVAHDVVQERRVDLLLDAFHQVKVLQVFHICRREEEVECSGRKKLGNTTFIRIKLIWVKWNKRWSANLMNHSRTVLQLWLDRVEQSSVFFLW